MTVSTLEVMTVNTLEGQALPVCGLGPTARDWLFVDGEPAGLLAVLERGQVGEAYAIGGPSERSKLDAGSTIDVMLDELAPHPTTSDRRSLIGFVEDRPGHDLRYAIDPRTVERELGWVLTESFEPGVCETISRYLENRSSWNRIRGTLYGSERLGLAERT